MIVNEEQRKSVPRASDIARRLLRALVEDASQPLRQRQEAAAALLRHQPHKRRPHGEAGRRANKKTANETESSNLGLALIGEDEREELRGRLQAEPGQGLFASQAREPAAFLAGVRMRAEASLYFFAKFILGMEDLSVDFHQGVAEFVQDVRGGRSKLLMLPVGTLKTSVASHGLPLHVLIQPRANNFYFPRQCGADMRCLLASESEPKAKENLSFIKRHCEQNRLLRGLWPEVFWEVPDKEAPRWSDTQIELRRTRIKPEPSITAIGVETGLHQRHYEVIVLDDLITLKAAQGPRPMERARNFRTAVLTRMHDPRTTITVGVGTHWGANDIYVDWKKERGVAVMCRSILETAANGQRESIWPERYPLEVIEDLRARTTSVLFSLNYMNIPVSASFTALDWELLRECRVERGKNQRLEVVFEEDKGDLVLAERMLGKGRKPGMRMERGRPFSALYRTELPKDFRQVAPGDRGWGREAFLRQKYADDPDYLARHPGLRELVGE